ncbi:hypothetical protein K458DRAFT_389428 [Lentithecium fluviatile CBS 122367]|uniref:Syntaxin N-terminal domain-containing protein n=1 Tax=Lentithecium fluviatile CBS 122367 TaxID=1168545 RepID=A0A6G1J1X5_9PLEO|nr:hypothetical protein K458DRAFT_389428 [Lentithecium fluviatile CBS 122367]
MSQEHDHVSSPGGPFKEEWMTYDITVTRVTGQLEKLSERIDAAEHRIASNRDNDSAEAIQNKRDKLQEARRTQAVSKRLFKQALDQVNGLEGSKTSLTVLVPNSSIPPKKALEKMKEKLLKAIAEVGVL